MGESETIWFVVLKLGESIITNTGKIHKSIDRAKRDHQHRGTNAERARIVAIATRVHATFARFTESPKSSRSLPAIAAARSLANDMPPSKAHLLKDCHQGRTCWGTWVQRLLPKPGDYKRSWHKSVSNSFGVWRDATVWGSCRREVCRFGVDSERANGEEARGHSLC